MWQELKHNKQFSLKSCSFNYNTLCVYSDFKLSVLNYQTDLSLSKSNILTQKFKLTDLINLV